MTTDLPEEQMLSASTSRNNDEEAEIILVEPEETAGPRKENVIPKLMYLTIQKRPRRES
jgi:hypothetical protein